MGPVGWPEMMVIFVIALLVFGPKKLPELGKTLGKAMTEFRRASSELKSTWEREMVNLERETEPLKEATAGIQKELNGYNDPYTYDDGSSESLSCDFTAQYPSTVSASAPEGAESIEAEAPETGVAPAEAATANEGATEDSAVAQAGADEEATEESAVAQAGADPVGTPKPMGTAEAEAATQTPAAVG